MIEESLYEYLRDDASVYAVCGGRVYPLVAPERAAKPHITYQITQQDRDRVWRGPTGMVRATIQIDCWSETQRGARQLAELVRLAFDNYRGNLGDHNVQVAKLVNALDAWEFAAAGTETIIGRVTQTWEVVYAETIPTR